MTHIITRMSLSDHRFASAWHRPAWHRPARDRPAWHRPAWHRPASLHRAFKVSADISCRKDHCAGAGAWRGSFEPYAPLHHALSVSVSEPT